MDEDFVVPPDTVRRFAEAALVQVGVRRRDAAVVADVLLAADLRGIDSHGVARLRRYVDGVRWRTISAHAASELISETPATALLDAHRGLGQPAAVSAMKLAIEKAAGVGVGMVLVRRTNHFGIAGYYAMMALERRMIGMVATNASPQVAPTHGAEPMYGTNPIAIAIPTGGPYPFVLDAATSAVPRGKLEQLEWRGMPMPEGWALDPDGRLTTDIGDLIRGLKERRGHALLPLGGLGETFGGHKGFGLGLFVDLLCGPLAGAAWGRHTYPPEGANLGQYFLAIDVQAFARHRDFESTSGALLDEIRAAKKFPGQQRIYVAGEKEASEAERRSREGIRLRPAVVVDLERLSEELGVPSLRSTGICV